MKWVFIAQKTFFIVTAVKTSNLTEKKRTGAKSEPLGTVWTE
jgi:hypothetical protein